MRASFFLVALSVFSVQAQAQDNPLIYKIFDGEGKKAELGDILKDCRKADMLFFGEQHNDATGHWLQGRLGKALHAEKGEALRIGAEMFETDNQLLLDELAAGLVPLKKFEDEAKLWPNYASDYKPLLAWAVEAGVPYIGTNIPRRYANLVYREGLAALDGLSDAAKAYVAPLPIAVPYDLPSYKAMADMMGGGHGSANLVAAQAVKDATMAHSILQHWQPGQFVYHLNGAYHSDSKEGIIWYLLQARPDLRIVSISLVEQDALDRLAEEHEGKADYIIVVPSDAPKSY